MLRDNFFIVHGPPGTGKTTYLVKQAQRAVEKYGDHKVLIASLTKAAAYEIGARDLPIQEEHIGTLHKMCYHELKQPHLAEARIKDWNSTYPHYRIKPSVDLDEPENAAHGATYRGTELFTRYTLSRARCETPVWGKEMQGFIKKWKDWKHSNQLFDFTDLLEMCLKDVKFAPGMPDVMIGDEAQDWSKLEMKLFRDHWGEYTEKIILAGDGDQALYTWRGADPAIFYDPNLPEAQQRELNQSYRVPKKPYDLSQEWIQRIEDRRAVHYIPKDSEGDVLRLTATSKNPEALLSFLEQEISHDRSVMILASCSFLLNSTLGMLKKRCIPYSNPYRKKRGDWNPLNRGTRKRVTTLDRFLSFINQPDWSPRDISNWVHVLKADLFKRGFKTHLEDLIDDEVTKGYVEVALQCEKDIDAVQKRDVTWFREHLLPTWKKRFKFCMDVADRRGVNVLQKSPQIIIGTIHSVKGGEASTVILYPDLSMEGMRQWIKPGEGRDSITRMFYVGATRTKDKLVLCRPAGPAYAKGLF